MTFKERIMLSAATYTRLQRYAIVLCLLCLLLISWWFLSFRALYRRYAELKQLSHAALLEHSEESSGKQIVEMSSELTVPTCTYQQFTEQFMRLTKLHDINLELYRCLSSRASELYQQTSISFTITGDFWPVTEFLKQLTGVICSRCELQSIGAGQVRCQSALELYSAV